MLSHSFKMFNIITKGNKTVSLFTIEEINF